MNLSKEFMTDIKLKYPRIPVMLEIDFRICWEFFDRACQGHPPVCGVGVVLYIKENHYIHVQYAPGK